MINERGVEAAAPHALCHLLQSLYIFIHSIASVPSLQGWTCQDGYILKSAKLRRIDTGQIKGGLMLTKVSDWLDYVCKTVE